MSFIVYVLNRLSKSSLTYNAKATHVSTPQDEQLHWKPKYLFGPSPQSLRSSLTSALNFSSAPEKSSPPHDSKGLEVIFKVLV